MIDEEQQAPIDASRFSEKRGRVMFKFCKHILRFTGVLWLIVTTGVLAADPAPIGGIADLQIAEFVLTIEEKNLVSLRARDASLEAILLELGTKLSIAIEGTVPKEETITTAFAQLPVTEALQHLSPNYGYQIGHEHGEPQIATIFVLPRPKGFVRPEPMPQAISQNESSTSQKSGTARSAETVKIWPRQSAEETEKEKIAQPEPFGFSFDPSVFQTSP